MAGQACLLKGSVRDCTLCDYEPNASAPLIFLHPQGQIQTLNTEAFVPVGKQADWPRKHLPQPIIAQHTSEKLKQQGHKWLGLVQVINARLPSDGPGVVRGLGEMRGSAQNPVDKLEFNI